MILELYLGFFAVSFLLLFYGWYVKADLYRYIGSTIIFLLGVVLMTSVPSILGRLELPSTVNITMSGVETIITQNYADYSNHGLGFLISMSGILSFIIIQLDRRSKAQER